MHTLRFATFRALMRTALIILLMVPAPMLFAQTTFTVDSTADTGDANAGDGVCDDGNGTCTLRAAIQEANAHPNGADPDEIHFDIAGVGPQPIQPTSALPEITDPTVVDGYTQTGAQPNTNPVGQGLNAVLRIVLDGGTLGSAPGLVVASGGGGSTIRGLVIHSFGGNGIDLGSTDDNVVTGNFIGTDVSGTAGLGNSEGMHVGGENNAIGGTTPEARNLLSANNFDGIRIDGDGNVVQGNLIGTDVSGIADLGNGDDGIDVQEASDNSIGGTTDGAQNVISGNADNGVQLSNATGTVIAGNFIGTDVNGTADLGNDGEGVVIGFGTSNTVGGTGDGAGNVISGNGGIGVVLLLTTTAIVQRNRIGTDVTGTADVGNAGAGVAVAGAPDNTIGGTAAGAGNLISGNGLDGIDMFGNDATGNLVQGNLIGTDEAGTAALANGNNGVFVEESASDNTIGGTIPGARNVISGNQEDGVGFDGSATTGNVVAGNFIGTDVSGTADLGNGEDGVFFANGASDNTVGGTTDGAGNTIAFNGGSGVGLADDAGTGNTIDPNALFENAALGIDLGNDGVTPNDGADADTGPNDHQNFPEIQSTNYDADADEVSITYRVPSDPANSAYPLHVEFFLTGADEEEGQTFIGADTYAEADFTGGPDKQVVFTPSATVTASDPIVATATDDDGNTSEFTSTATPLPVELVAFTAVVDDDAVVLRWTTASETNNAGFEIQHLPAIETRDLAALPWQTMIFVDGRGTTTEAQSYQHRAKGLAPGTHRFRLKQIDFDGTFEYSSEVEVSVGVPDAYRLSSAYPNPFNPRTQVSLTVAREQHVWVAVYDALGRRVALLHDGIVSANAVHRFSFEATDQPSGRYVIQVRGETFATHRQVVLVK